MSAAEYNFDINRGGTWTPVFRWASDTLVSKAITAITAATPAAITATAHGMPDGWPAVVASASGMVQINTPNFPPRSNDWKQATLVDANTVNFNKVDSTLFSAYTSGGFLVYPTPTDLSAVTAMVLNIYDTPTRDNTPLTTLAIGTGITLDNVAKTIAAVLATTGLTWTTGYFELQGTIGIVTTPLLVGTLTIVP